ncbi:MAG: hypothetical protein ABIF40_02690 [archaeon]
MFKKITNKIFLNKTLRHLIYIFIIIFGLFIIFQILRKILGGSWVKEDIIIAFLVANLTITIGLGFSLSKLNSDVKHLRNQFNALASDFKTHRKDFSEMKMDVRDLKRDITGLKSDMKVVKRSVHDIKPK